MHTLSACWCGRAGSPHNTTTRLFFPQMHCRNKERAQALAAALPAGVASVVDWADLQSGAVSADVLANSTSVGMVPNVEDTPVATGAIKNVGDRRVFLGLLPSRLTAASKILGLVIRDVAGSAGTQ